MLESALPRAPSLRRTLLLYLGLLSLLATGTLFYLARDYGHRAADRSYDHLLLSSALSIVDSVALADGQWEVDLPYAALDLLAMAPEDRVFYRVADADGSTITGYDDLPRPLRIPEEGEPLMFDARYSGEPVRFTVVTRRFSSPASQDQVVVQVGQTRRARQALSNDLVLRATAAALLLSILSLLLVWLGVRRALRPLKQLEADLSHREPSDLKPLREGAPEELEQMVGALNRFMSRLQDSNESLRAFMAEAAHQMRTPLAAIRAQAQLGVEEDEAAQMRRSLEAIERNASHMSRLLYQLLSDASVLHRASLQTFEVIDLGDVLRQAVTDALPPGGAQPPVQLTIPEAPARVRGDALLLREAFKNLIDNAVRHAGEGPLALSMTAMASHCEVTLADRGPGIDMDDAGRVFERFARGANAGPGGAGLGLAIVRRVMEAHQGRVTLANRDGGGLQVTVVLPRTA
ncbi:MAG: sensor histidine kinase N-terminal domain-containing protein [Pseudoxanthomonas sp.]